MLDLETRIEMAIGRATQAAWQVVSNLFSWRNATRSTSDGTGEAIEGLPADGEDSSSIDTIRVQHAGFRSRYAKGMRFGLTLGTRTWTIGEDDGQAEAVPLEDGEAVVYSPKDPTCRAFFDKDGKLHLDGASQETDVIVNGGELEVARRTDPVTVTGGSYSSSSLTLQIKDANGAAGTLVVTVTGSAALLVTPSGAILPTGNFTMGGTVADGAPHFKA